MLGLDIETRSRAAVPTIAEAADALPAEVLALKSQRDEARKSKDFARSDALRSEIESQVTRSATHLWGPL